MLVATARPSSCDFTYLCMLYRKYFNLSETTIVHGVLVCDVSEHLYTLNLVRDYRCLSNVGC